MACLTAFGKDMKQADSEIEIKLLYLDWQGLTLGILKGLVLDHQTFF